MLQAEPKLKRGRVELSRNRETPRPLSKIRVEMLFSRSRRDGFFPGQKKIPAEHALEIQGVQFAGILFNRVVR
jgi:hypothetical protein